MKDAYLPAFEGYTALMNRKYIESVGGWKAGLDPSYHHVELSVRLQGHALNIETNIGSEHQKGMSPGNCINSAAIYIDEYNQNKDAEKCLSTVIKYVSKSAVVYRTINSMNRIIHPLDNHPVETFMLPDEVKLFELSPLLPYITTSYVTPLKVKWHMHCGGSMGYETTMFLSDLEKLVDVRTYPQRYGECEHLNTIDTLDLDNPFHVVECCGHPKAHISNVLLLGCNQRLKATVGCT